MESSYWYYEDEEEFTWNNVFGDEEVDYGEWEEEMEADNDFTLRSENVETDSSESESDVIEEEGEENEESDVDRMEEERSWRWQHTSVTRKQCFGHFYAVFHQRTHWTHCNGNQSASTANYWNLCTGESNSCKVGERVVSCD
jgi:hypothetical protein